MASTRGISRFGDGPTAESFLGVRSVRKQNTSNTCEEHMNHCKVGAEDWPVSNFELSKDSTFVNCQIHKTVFKRHHHPTKVTRTTSIMEPSKTEPTNVTDSPIMARSLATL